MSVVTVQNGFTGNDPQTGEFAIVDSAAAVEHYLPRLFADFCRGIGYGGNPRQQIWSNIITAHDSQLFADGNAVVGAIFINMFKSAAGDDQRFDPAG